MNITALRKRFPQIVSHPEDVYLDNASTTLKVDTVIERMVQFYTKETSNVHRGNHFLSSKATTLYEKSRETVAQFINAQTEKEVVFVRGVTEGMNFLAYTLCDQLQEGDEIVITEMEHHSNYLPWVRLAQQKKLTLRQIPVTPSGELDLSHLNINDKTKIVSVVHQSNALGTVNDIQTIINKSKEVGALSIIDAAQSVSTMPIDVQALDCDFLLFSGHKIFAPSGVGVIYGKMSLWEKMKPYHVGGGMVSDAVKQEWAHPPHCFEAGTPAIENILGLETAIQFLQQACSFNEIQKHEKLLLQMAEELLVKIPGVQIIGTSPSRINTLSFIVDNIHCDDIGQLIGEQKVAIRSGHHCCQPLMDKYKLSSGTIRASVSLYNIEKDIQILESSVKKALSILR